MHFCMSDASIIGRGKMSAGDRGTFGRDSSVCRATDERHHPTDVAVSGIEETIRHIAGPESRRIERECMINTFEDGTKDTNGIRLFNLPREGREDRFRLTCLADEDHRDRGLIDNIFEEIGDDIKDSLSIFFTQAGGCMQKRQRRGKTETW